MKKIIIMTLLINSSSIYAHSIEANIMDICESEIRSVDRAGFVSMEKQKNLERYQMEVRLIKNEEQEKLQNQFRSNNNINDKIYESLIDRHSNDLMANRVQNKKKS